MFLKTFLILLLIIVSAYQPFNQVFADDDFSVKDELINPGSFYYSFKRLWEKGMEKIQFSNQSKINFYKSQVNIKLAELNHTVENKILSEVQTSSERFASQAGNLSDLLIKENKDKEETIKEFQKMQKFLEKLRDKYPSNTSFWMLIQHDINTLGILSEKLK